MATFYPAKPDPCDSQSILPILRELYSRRPETRALEPWELAHVLFSLGYTDGLGDEDEIAAAAAVARTDFDPDEGAA